MCRVFRHMPNLVSVDLSSLVQVNDEVIKTLAETCPNTLQGLNINGCRMVGDEAVCLLAEKCHNLRRVSYAARGLQLMISSKLMGVYA